MIIDADPNQTDVLDTAELGSAGSLRFDPRKLDSETVVREQINLLRQHWTVVNQFTQGDISFTVYKVPTSDLSKKFFTEKVEISSGEVVGFYRSDQNGVSEVTETES